MTTNEDVPIDAGTELAAFVEGVCAEITKLRTEITELRADGERFRIKLMREFVALVDEYRNIDAIRSGSAGQ